MSSTRPPVEPHSRVVLAVNLYKTTGYVPFTLSTAKYVKGRLKQAEILVNSSMHFHVDELSDWTPAQAIFVVSNTLVLPGDEVWYSPGIE